MSTSTAILSGQKTKFKSSGLTNIATRPLSVVLISTVSCIGVSIVFTIPHIYNNMSKLRIFETVFEGAYGMPPHEPIQRLWLGLFVSSLIITHILGFIVLSRKTFDEILLSYIQIIFAVLFPIIFLFIPSNYEFWKFLRYIGIVTSSFSTVMEFAITFTIGYILCVKIQSEWVKHNYTTHYYRKAIITSFCASLSFLFTVLCIVFFTKPSPYECYFNQIVPGIHFVLSFLALMFAGIYENLVPMGINNLFSASFCVLYLTISLVISLITSHDTCNNFINYTTHSLTSQAQAFYMFMKYLSLTVTMLLFLGMFKLCQTKQKGYIIKSSSSVSSPNFTRVSYMPSLIFYITHLIFTFRIMNIMADWHSETRTMFWTPLSPVAYLTLKITPLGICYAIYALAMCLSKDKNLCSHAKKLLL